jgi:hypothetical protein
MLAGDLSISSQDFYTLPAAAFGTELHENFEAYNDYETTPTNSINLNSAGGIVAVLGKSGVNGLTYDIGGFGASQNSFMWNFYGIPTGGIASLVFEKLDLSQASGHGLTFSHSYSQYSASVNDRLRIMISTDCGVTWDNIWDKQGADLSTAPFTNSGNFFPQSTQWVANSLDLSAYDGNTEVVLKFEGVSAYGNNLYVDDINIESSVIAVNEVASTSFVSVYPSPAIDAVTMDIGLEHFSDFTIQMVDVLGEVVYSQTISGSLSFKEQISIADFPVGLYSVNIIFEDQSSVTRKIVKVK